MANLEMKVSVEKCIHDDIRSTFQSIADEHGLRIEKVEAVWLDISTMGQNKVVLRDLTLLTASKQGQ